MRRMGITTLVLASVTAHAAVFTAGFAERVVTPKEPLPMWGYEKDLRPDNVSTGVHDDLFARAIVLGAGDDKVAIVGIDMGRAPTPAMVSHIRDAVKEKVGVDYIVLNGSHTHHGPALEWPNEAGERFRAQLESALIDVIVEAAGNAVPAKVGYASGESKWNRNRHSAWNPDLKDPELLVYRFDGLDGAPIAMLINFAGHPTVHPPQNNKFSAEYPGVMRREVDKALGVKSVFIQGAAGDMQCEMDDDLWGKKDFIEPVGQGIAAEVIALAKEIETAEPDTPSVQGMDEDFTCETRFDLADDDNMAPLAEAYGPELVGVVREAYPNNTMHPHLTTVLINGDIAVVGVSGEFFCEHSLNLKRNLHGMKLIFAGYCNGHDMYFPTIMGAAEGGYGADPGASWAEVGTAERMMDKALMNLYALKAETE